MDKQAARDVLLARYAAIPEDIYIDHSQGAAKNALRVVSALLLDGDVSSALLYTSVSKWREPSLEILPEKYSTIAFDFVAANKNALIPLKRYDIIFVPLFGFNNQGYRLGRGGGWYDRLLAMQPQALKIGVGLEEGLIDFAVESHDIPMDVLITEDRCQVFTQS